MGFAPPRIVVGSDAEPVVRLTRQDWRGPKAGWAKDSVGHWDVTVATAGKYEIKVTAKEAFQGWNGDVKGEKGGVNLGIGLPIREAAKEVSREIELAAGNYRVEFTVHDAGGKNVRGPDTVEFMRVEPKK
jgi:hypothetical protein